MTNLFCDLVEGWFEIFDLEEGWFKIFELVRTFLCRRAPFWLAVRLSSDLSYATPGPAQKQKTDKPTHFGPKKILRADFLNQYSQKRQFSGSFVLFSHLSEKRDLRLRTRSSHARVVFSANLRPDIVSFILMKSKRTRHKMSKITWIGIVFIFRAVSFESRDELGLVGRLRSRVTGKRRSKGSTRLCAVSQLGFISRLRSCSANVHRRLKIAAAEICVWPRRVERGRGVSRLKASEERRGKWKIWGRRRN